MDRVICSFRPVIPGKVLAQPVGLYPHDGIFLGIEIVRTAQDLNADRVSFN